MESIAHQSRTPHQLRYHWDYVHTSSHFAENHTTEYTFYLLTYCVSELLELGEVLVVSALLNASLHHLSLVLLALQLFLQTPVPEHTQGMYLAI